MGFIEIFIVSIWKEMTVTGLYQIIGVKVDLYYFFSAILENYKLTKKYTEKIIRNFPSGVDKIIEGYINYYNITEIYRDFEEYIYKYNKGNNDDPLTMDYLIDFLKTQDDDWISELIDDIAYEDYQIDSLIDNDKPIRISYQKVPHNMEYDQVIVGCYIGTIVTNNNFYREDLSIKDYIVNLEHVLMIKNKIAEKIQKLGFDSSDVQLYMIPDGCECC